MASALLRQHRRSVACLNVVIRSDAHTKTAHLVLVKSAGTELFANQFYLGVVARHPSCSSGSVDRRVENRPPLFRENGVHALMPTSSVSRARRGGAEPKKLTTNAAQAKCATFAVSAATELRLGFVTVCQVLPPTCVQVSKRMES